MDIAKIEASAMELANALNADVILYNGAIERNFDDELIDLCLKAERRENVILMLCTYGGDPDAAYRIARCLQKNYTKFIVCIAGACKSAGTLIAVGAHEIVMTDQAELGPLDIQLGKKDELWETDSGLTILSAIKTLEEKAFDLFESCFLNLKTRSGGRITLRTASELASTLAVGVISPIVGQIDPLHVGEVSRAMNIGLEYGKRLSSKSKNQQVGTIEKLANSYPSHGFVIDREEAKDLFIHVREPGLEVALIELLAHLVKQPNGNSPIITFISKPVGENENENCNQENSRADTPEGGGTVLGDQENGGREEVANQSSETTVRQLSEKLTGKARNKSQ